MDRRIEARFRCADMVEVSWLDPSGATLRTLAALADISISGVRLVSQIPIELGVEISCHYPGGALVGTVQSCVRNPLDYSIGIRFEPGTESPICLIGPNGQIRYAQ